MNIDFRWFIIIIGNFLLLFITQLVNDALASLSLHLCFYGLFAYVPTVIVPFSIGLISSLITGFIIDTVDGFSMGTNVIIISLIYTACYWFRGEFKMYSSWHNILFAQLANFSVFIILTIHLGLEYELSGYYGLSSIINLVISQLLLIIIGPWFMSIQHSLMHTVYPNIERRRSHR